MLSSFIARACFGIPFIIFGIIHFVFAESLKGIVPNWVPGEVIWVYITGLCLLSAGVSILTKKMAILACKLLAILLTIFILTIHIPGLMTKATSQIALVSLLKDLALIGGALTLAGVFEKKSNKQ